VEAALSGDEDHEPLTRVDVPALSDERMSLVAKVVARVLVARALVELGILPGMSEGLEQVVIHRRRIMANGKGKR
jgi:hypothetical protein